MNTKLLLVFSAFLLVYSMIGSVQCVVSFGVSDLSPNITVYYEETVTVDVARIYNQGDEPLNVSAGWSTTTPNVTNVITPSQPWIILLPNESRLVSVTILPKQLGICFGKIDFKAYPLQSGGGGNPVVAGGSANLMFTVEYKEPAPAGFVWPFPPQILAVPAFAVPFSVGLGLYMRRRSHKPATLPKIVDKPTAPVQAQEKHGRFSRHKKAADSFDLPIVESKPSPNKAESYAEILASAFASEKAEIAMLVQAQATVTVEKALKPTVIAEPKPASTILESLQGKWSKDELNKLELLLLKYERTRK